jgi:hypothetical protein
MLNTSTNGGTIVDATSNLVASFDGVACNAVIIDVRSNTGRFINHGESNGTVWNSSKESWPSFLCRASLRQALEGNGTTFTSTNASKEISDQVARTLGNLDPYYANQFNRSSSGAVETLAKLSDKVAGLFNGPMKGYLTLTGTSAIPIRFNALALAQFWEGLSMFFNSIKGGTGTLLAKRGRFDLNPVMNAGSGFDALAILLKDLARQFDLNQILNDSLNSPRNLLVIVIKLGGGVDTGTTGLAKNIYQTLFANGTSNSTNPPLTALRVSGRNTNSTGGGLVGSIRRLLDQVIGIGSVLGDVNRFLRSLLVELNSSLPQTPDAGGQSEDEKLGKGLGRNKHSKQAKKGNQRFEGTFFWLNKVSATLSRQMSKVTVVTGDFSGNHGENHLRRQHEGKKDHLKQKQHKEY